MYDNANETEPCRGTDEFAVQVAKAHGAIVTATATGAGLDLASALGADEAVDYKSTDLSSLGRRFGVVFDTVSSLTRDEADQLIDGPGHHVNLSPGPPAADDYQSTFTGQHTQMTTERMTRLIELITARTVTPQIGYRFTFAEAIATLATIESGDLKFDGKAVARNDCG